MKYVLILSLVALLFSTPAKAEDPHEELVHFSAHAGLSYIGTTFLFGFMHKAIGLEVNDSLEFSIFTTLLLGLVYKDLEAISNRSQGIPELGTSMLYNGIGCGAAMFTIKAFQF